MEQAGKMQGTRQFEQAIQAYALVAQNHPGTPFYKEAALRLFFLFLDPENPKTDLAKAGAWLDRYLTTPLSPGEKESAKAYKHLLDLSDLTRKKAETLQKEIGGHKTRILTLEGLLKKTRKQLQKAKTALESAKDAQEELALLKEKLEKLKAVDVQMHKARKKME